MPASDVLKQQDRALLRSELAHDFKLRTRTAKIRKEPINRIRRVKLDDDGFDATNPSAAIRKDFLLGTFNVALEQVNFLAPNMPGQQFSERDHFR